ncbi:alpha/beta hydrolase [Mycolicibacterium moriokaense]|uniref:Alpha/beta hydrolase n=1 Tax=Mycolicibacterium moriokaense TaxID=39691 RepID=A0AAD1H710_9MYCO|nr:alpha/beta hydrolase [Mycolicibacterium moriokaense]MCV7037484.1 alpha/beta hydrolase [Mycolicibacterium moriokaense]ORB14761.1 alpha/beta hydrolase [Mycolicibacterium moriokaense]BBW99578.1 alpha/beta hydrolase [Mycolicibacterium moriokaense]
MPVVMQDDLEIAYEIIGEGEPYILTGGGRFSKDAGGVRELAEAIADRGKKVVIYDRLNCGASAVCFEGDSESVMQADSLARLISDLNLGPTVLLGGSGGARISLLAAARHPDIARAVVMWWPSGGAFGSMSLAEVYNFPSIRAAWNGTMADVADLPTWAEVIERNPRNRDRFLAQDKQTFIETMERWAHAYCACGNPLVAGLTDEEAAAISLPVLVFRSGKSDYYHTRATSERLAANLQNAEIIDPVWGDREFLDRFEDSRDNGVSVWKNWKQLAPQIVDWAEARLD